MHKTVIAPGQGPIESDELDEPQTALAVATHHADHTDVEIKGLVFPEQQSCLGRRDWCSPRIPDSSLPTRKSPIHPR